MATLNNLILCNSIVPRNVITNQCYLQKIASKTYKLQQNDQNCRKKKNIKKMNDESQIAENPFVTISLQFFNVFIKRRLSTCSELMFVLLCLMIKSVTENYFSTFVEVVGIRKIVFG